MIRVILKALVHILMLGELFMPSFIVVADQYLRFFLKKLNRFYNVRIINLFVKLLKKMLTEITCLCGI